MNLTIIGLKHAFRKNMIILFATIGFLLSIILVMYYEEQTFSTEKRDYIVRYKDTFLPERGQMPEDAILRMVQSTTITNNNSDIDSLRQYFQSIVDSTTSIIYRIEIRNTNNELLMVKENLGKYKEFNNYRNCLFFLGFSKAAILPLRREGLKPVDVVMYYTSLPSDPELEKMVSTYRWKIYPILLLLLGLYLGSLYWFILPVRRVIDKLEAIKQKFLSPIESPRTLIEAAYNQMARNTSILNVNLRIIDLVAAQPKMTVEQVLLKSVEMIREIFPQAYLIRRSENTGVVQVHQEQGQNSSPDLKNSIQVSMKQSDEVNNLDILECVISGKPSLMGKIDSMGQEIWFLGIVQSRNKASILEYDKRALLTLTQQIRLAIQSKELQRRFVEQEKSQVSIHLARNLGHDVTNIIASVRLDLDSLKKIFQDLPNTTNPAISEKNQHVLSESLNGLNHGTQLLQEIVDVYRSFMYLEKPVFEKIPLEPVVTRMVELFRRATTQRIEIKTEFASHLPEIILEPRLFKLAIFNLLTNSLEAVKKSSVDKPISGLIEILVTLDNAKKNILISIKDNGPGFRHSDGTLLQENETRTIFQYGYSTKEKGPGGLGLAWVYTILCEIHKGTILPQNRPTGGAEFTIILPISS